MAQVQAPRRASPRNATARRYNISMGKVDGSIIATIMAAHIRMKTAAAAPQLCPAIRIHIMDMRQPPGIAIVADKERADHKVNAAVARNTAIAVA